MPGVRPARTVFRPMAKATPDLMERIVSLCKRRGFVFQSSEIYGGLKSCWDYGPLGSELKRNVKDLWWRSMTQERDDIAGLDATIIMHPTVWRASIEAAGSRPAMKSPMFRPSASPRPPCTRARRPQGPGCRADRQRWHQRNGGARRPGAAGGRAAARGRSGCRGGGSCGACQLLPGQVSSEGRCNSWSARS